MKVRFPNESTSIDVIDFNMNEFKEDKVFEKEVFGWWKDTYVSVDRIEYDLNKSIIDLTNRLGHPLK